MPNLNKLVKDYKDAASDARVATDTPNFDAEEYMALVETRNSAAQMVAAEILRLLKGGKRVSITDISALRQALGDIH